MKIFPLLALMLSVSSSMCDNDTIPDWDTFKTQFGKNYTQNEEDMRRAIYYYNADKIHKHNQLAVQGIHSHYLGVNQFSDLTPDEFHNFLNKLLKYLNIHKKTDGGVYFENGEDYVRRLPDNLLPEKVDWRSRGVVTPVNDQGTCGCCWAFSATGAMESAWAIAKGELVNLSAQNLLDCTIDEITFGCEGGNMDSAFQYVISNGGINAADCYKYNQKQHSRCRYKKHCRSVRFSKFCDINEGDELALQEAVATHGPVSAAINGDNIDFQHYRSGIYSHTNCKKDVTHGVLVVGYGTDNGQDYWIVKNSWGTDWGIGGFFKLARNQNMCGIAEMASFPVI